MQRSLLALVVGALGLPLTAAEILYTVTPQSLGAWSTAGVDKSSLAVDKTLSLPAGAQLGRKFPEGAVILRLVTRPVFSETPSEWPILEVGPAAVALIRKAGEGRLVLVVDETKAAVLPWTIPLTGKDDSCEIVLAFDPSSGTGFISLKDQVQTFEATPPADPVEVWLSAGSKSAWPQDLMEVLLLTDENDAGTPKTTEGKAAKSAKPIDRLKSALDDLLERDSDKSKSKTTGATSNIVAASGETVSMLEIFTPPSVRRAKVVEVVRAAVVRKKDK